MRKGSVPVAMVAVGLAAVEFSVRLPSLGVDGVHRDGVILAIDDIGKTVAFVTLANGGDNIGIYTPSFAIRSGNEIALIGLIFAVMTGLWCFLAQWMVNHPKFGSPIRRYGHRTDPIVLIALGVLILNQAGS